MHQLAKYSILLWLTAAAAGVRSEEPAVLPIQALEASGDDGKGNVAANAVDGDPATRWSTGSLGEWLRLDLGRVVRLQALQVHWGAARRHEFSLHASDTGSHWTPLLTRVHSGSSPDSGFETYPLEGCGRYLRLTVRGYSTGTWSHVREVRVLGFPSDTRAPVADPVAVEEPYRLRLASVRATGHDGVHDPENINDGNPATRWATGKAGEQIVLELSKPADLTSVRIAWPSGNRRTYRFMAEVAATPGVWETRISDGISSGSGETSEYYALRAESARWLRITVKGNSENSWSHISELEVHGTGGEKWRHPALDLYPVTADLKPVSEGDAFSGFSYYGLTPESPDGTRVLYARFRGIPGSGASLMVCRRDLTDHRELLRLEQGCSVHNTIQPVWLDNTRVACTAGGKTYIVDADSGTVMGEPIEGRMNHHPYETCILVPMDEPANAHGPERGLYEINVDTRKARLVIAHDDLVVPFAEHYRDGADTAKGRIIVQHAQYSPKGTFIAVKVIVNKTGEVYCLTFRRDGSDTAWFGPKPMHYQWYDDETLWGHDSEVDDGSENNKFIKRWDRTGRLVEVLSGYGCHPAMSPDRKWFATESWYSSNPVVLRLYRSGSTEPVAVLMASDDVEPVWKLRAHLNPSFSPDGTRVYFNMPVSDTVSQARYADVTPYVGD